MDNTSVSVTSSPNITTTVLTGSDYSASTTGLYYAKPRWMSSFVFMVAVSVTLSLIILVAVVGNSCVIAAFCIKRRLRKPSNYFILNLAVADLSLAILVLPISAVYDVSGSWLFGAEVCLVWTVFDVFVSTASILSLVAISADRYMAISNSLMYPKLITGKRVGLILAIVYFISLTISIPPVLGWGKQQTIEGECFLPYSPGYVIYSAIGSFYLPFIIMSVLYCKIYKVAKTHMRNIKKRSVVGSLLDIGGEIERSDRSLFFSDDKNMNRRLTGSSSGYSSGKPAPRFSQTSRSTTDTLPHHSITGSRFSLAKQDSSDTLMVPGRVGPASQKSRGYLFISPMSSRSSRSSGSVSDFDGGSLAVPRDSMRSSRSSSSSYGGDMESDLIQAYFKQNLPRASYVSNASSANSRTKRSPISRRIKRFVSERKAAKTVSIIVGAFMICWTPFSIVYLLNGVCKEQCRVSDTVFKICFWLGYVNSVLNPIIYSMYNRDMKSALISMLAPLCCACCIAKRSRGHTKSSASIGSFVSVGDSDWQYDDTISVTEDVAPAKPAEKHLNRQVRQSMPTANCPVQVYINEPRKSRAGSVVSWSMAALRGTLHDRLSELDKISNEDGLSLQSEKSVVLPAVSFTMGAGDEGDTESQASTLERCHLPHSHAGRSSSGLKRRSSVSMDDFSHHRHTELSSTSHSNSHISPRSQRRRSSAAALFLTPEGDSGWAKQIERDFARRSSKIPSLEDIQETLSQDTRRSSDETCNNVTRQNSFDQMRNPSLDGTSSANSTLQDSRKSSSGGVTALTYADITNSTLPLINTPGDGDSYGRSESPDYDTCHSLSKKRNVKRKLSSNSQSDRSPESHSNSLCKHGEKLSPHRSRERLSSPVLPSNNVAPVNEGIVVTLIPDTEAATPVYKTLCLSINQSPTQHIQNIQIIFNPPQSAPTPLLATPTPLLATPTRQATPIVGKNESANEMLERERHRMGGLSERTKGGIITREDQSNSLKPMFEDQRLQKSSSDSCLLPVHGTKPALHRLCGVAGHETQQHERSITTRECLSAPAVRKLYQKGVGSELLDSPDENWRPYKSQTQGQPGSCRELNIHSNSYNSYSPLSPVRSNSTLSSLALDILFDSLESDDPPPSDTTTSTDRWTNENIHTDYSVSPIPETEPIWRSKSEPILTRSPSFNTITPKYAKYLQGFISAKHRGRRRDSIISSVNTDYTYEESIQAPSLIGTEYEGHSQRSSLTSNIVMDPQAEGRVSSVCGTEYEGDNSQRSSLTSNHHDQITFQAEVHAPYDDIMVPAIHVTETDDITTVIQAASTKFLSLKARGKSRSQPNMGDRGVEECKPEKKQGLPHQYKDGRLTGIMGGECAAEAGTSHPSEHPDTKTVMSECDIRGEFYSLLDKVMPSVAALDLSDEITRQTIQRNMAGLQNVVSNYISRLVSEMSGYRATLAEADTQHGHRECDVVDEVLGLSSATSQTEPRSDSMGDDSWV